MSARCSGPRELQFQFQHEISPDCAYRLACTCWANAQLEVIPGFTSSLGAVAQDQSVHESCADEPSDSLDQAGHVNTAVVMAGGSVSQTELA